MILLPPSPHQITSALQNSMRASRFDPYPGLQSDLCTLEGNLQRHSTCHLSSALSFDGFNSHFGLLTCGGLVLATQMALKKKKVFLKGKESQRIPQCLVPKPYMAAWVGGGCGMLSAAASMERAVVPLESTFGGSRDKDAGFGLDPAVY